MIYALIFFILTTVILLILVWYLSRENRGHQYRETTRLEHVGSLESANVNYNNVLNDLAEKLIEREDEWMKRCNFYREQLEKLNK